MRHTISCIVPYHDEAPRINTTLDTLVSSNYLTEIIAVDDGSTDNPIIDTKKYSSHVSFIKLETNNGKSAAVFAGLAIAAGTLILLIDSDLKNLRCEEIDTACKKMLDHPELDMLILKSTQGTLITRVCRQDIVLSGARILKKSDLNSIARLKPHGYQLEVAINAYMIDHVKSVRFCRFSAYNTLRSEKIGMLPATFGLMKLLKDVYDYRGYIDYIRQLFTFCHRELE